MKTVTITLHKNVIYDYINSHSYKRVDAAMDGQTARTQNAVSSDTNEENDLFLISEYCDRRDALIRQKLRFCLVDLHPEDNVFDNSLDTGCKYEYVLNVQDDFSSNDLQSVGKLLDWYIKKGALRSWYLGAGVEPLDSEDSLDEIEDELINSLRGQPWGHRPMQPFGPARYDFYGKKNHR